MRKVPDWDEYFLGLAEAAKLRSKDPNTQVGALIVSPDRRRTVIGYNGMPEGMDEGSCWDDACKDDHVIHAEQNAISNAARTGVPVEGATIYITLPPCLPCARAITAAGIKRVVYPSSAYWDWVNRKPVWKERFQRALDYLYRNKVTYHALRND